MLFVDYQIFAKKNKRVWSMKTCHDAVIITTKIVKIQKVCPELLKK